MKHCLLHPLGEDFYGSHRKSLVCIEFTVMMQLTTESVILESGCVLRNLNLENPILSDGDNALKVH